MGTLTLHQTSLGFTDIRQLELVLQRSDLGAHTSVTSLVTPLVTPLVTSLVTPLVTPLVTTIMTPAVVIPVPIRAAWSGACKYENIRLLFRWLYNMYV